MISDLQNNSSPIKSLYADDDLIAEILPAFVHNLPKYVEQLRVAICTGDIVAAAKVCHDLKGTAGGYGYPQIGSLAQTLEDEVKGGFDLPEASILLEQIARLCHLAMLGLDH
jgi:HPt (histidine-containing phosphotransfer) domain-containing protein